MRPWSYNFTGEKVIGILFLVVFTLYGPFAEEVDVNDSHESESETIRKCLEDLNSDADEVRKRAVLILGKYSNPLAINGIIRSLEDKNPDIRRSALVSLTEKPVMQNAAESILNMIGDSDVHIRRIASSYIPEIMRSYRNHLQGRLGPSGFGKSSKKFQNLISQSFLDEDSIVRKNMMTHHQYFRGLLKKVTLRKLLNDPDREVRVLALNASRVVFPGREFIEAVGPLSSDSDPFIRKRLINLLGNLNDSSGDEILHKLLEDKNFEISTEAFLALFRRQDFSIYPELRKRLDSPQIKSQTVSNIINLIPLMGEDGEEALLELMAHPSLKHRQVALEVYGRSYRKNANVKMLVNLMNDPSKVIRDTANRIFLQLQKIEFKEMQSLISSPYLEARQIALTVSKRLPLSQAEEVIMELILDEITEIRLLAIEEAIRRRIKGWEMVAEQTLTDEDVEIQQKTVMLLLNVRSKKTDEILLNFTNSTDNTILKQVILEGLN